MNPEDLKDCPKIYGPKLKMQTMRDKTIQPLINNFLARFYRGDFGTPPDYIQDANAEALETGTGSIQGYYKKVFGLQHDIVIGVMLSDEEGEQIPKDELCIFVLYDMPEN